MTTPSVIVIQRGRNRLIEWLDACAGVRADDDLNELVNQWFDWVQDDATLASFPALVYSTDEAHRLLAVHACLDRFREVTPQTIVDTARALQLSEWRALVLAVAEARQTLGLRGLLPEDEEDSGGGS